MRSLWSQHVCVGYSCNHLRHTCQRGAIDYGELVCQSLAGRDLDEAIGRLLLEALRPASLELRLAAASDIAKQRQDNDRQWQHRLESINYDTELARRSYASVDPEHRLVARQLESRWEEKLSQQEQLHLEYRRIANSQPQGLSQADRSRVQSLSENVEQLWHAETTTAEDRQTIARMRLDRVVVTVDPAHEQVDVEVHWAGGFNSHHRESRPVDRYAKLSNYAELVNRILELKSNGSTLVDIASTLNDEGYRPANRAKNFNQWMVTRLLRRIREERGEQQKSSRDRKHLKKNEWWLSDLALELKMPIATMHRWRRVGWVRARNVSGTGGHWALCADASELKRLAKLRDYRRGWGESKTPIELTTPMSKSR